MPDFLQMLRMRNLFGAQMPNMNDMPDEGSNLGMPSFTNPMDEMNGGSQSPWSNINFGNTDMNAPQPAMAGPTPNDGGYDVASRMAQIYHPQHDASDRFDALIKGYPQREQPSKMRKFGGALLGALAAVGDPTQGREGGPANHAMGMKVYNDISGKTRFDENVEDWKNQMSPTQAAANLERYQNTNDRTAAYQTVSGELRAHAQEAKDKNDATNAQIRTHRADVYDFKAHNPGMKLITPKGGNIQAYDPITGETKDTGIPSGSLTDLDKINLQADDKMEQIHATGDERRKTVVTQGEEARKTKTTVGGGTLKPGTGPNGKPELPTQTRVRQFNAARELFNTHPEVQQFLKLGNNDFTLTPPSKNFFGQDSGPSQEQYDLMKKAIYGEGAIDIAQPGRTGKGDVPVNSPNMGTKPLSTNSNKFSGKRVVVYKNGQPAGTIPEEQVDMAKSKGYEVR